MVKYTNINVLVYAPVTHSRITSTVLLRNIFHGWHQKIKYSLMPQSHSHRSTPRYYYGIFSTIDTGKSNDTITEHYIRSQDIVHSHYDLFIRCLILYQGLYAVDSIIFKNPRFSNLNVLSSMPGFNTHPKKVYEILHCTSTCRVLKSWISSR